MGSRLTGQGSGKSGRWEGLLDFGFLEFGLGLLRVSALGGYRIKDHQTGIEDCHCLRFDSWCQVHAASERRLFTTCQN